MYTGPFTQGQNLSRRSTTLRWNQRSRSSFYPKSRSFSKKWAVKGKRKEKISENICRLQPLTCWSPQQLSYCLTLVARWDSGLDLEFCRLSTLLSTSACPGFPLWKIKSCHNHILEARAVGCPNSFFLIWYNFLGPELRYLCRVWRAYLAVVNMVRLGTP